MKIKVSMHKLNRASDISRKKSKFSRDFQGQIRRKIGRFRGKKVKICGKSTDFAGFSQKKVKFRRIFRGKFSEKSADFTGNFSGKLIRQQTIK